MTPEFVQALTGDAKTWTVPLRDACELNDIDTPRRLAFFLANCSHETAAFTKLREDLHYSAASLLRVFPRRITPQDAVTIAYDERRIGNFIYAGMLGNGDEASGDGYAFRGGGLAMLTGRDNYRAASVSCGIDLEAEPERIVDPLIAALTAGWFWRERALNDLADLDDFAGIVAAWNGPARLGLPQRVALAAHLERLLA